jgi:oligopeptide transport system substrate-binding protein
MRSALRVVVATLVIALVAAACSSNSSSGGTESSGAAGVQGGTYSVLNCEPQTLIPHNDYESCGTQAFQGLWSRLVKFNADTLLPEPDQAESIEISDDGLTYTIKIKSGWTFHNGEPVTAQSYVDAWNYTAYGPNGYILNFFFDKIQGYDAMNSDKPTAKELSGLKVIDDTTFEVTLNDPFGQFEYTLGFDAFDPLPQAFYDDPKAFDESPIGDGQYMMDGKWKHDETINLQRYPDFGGTTPGSADKVELRIYSGDAGWLDFQAGNLDLTYVGSDHLQEARNTYPDNLAENPGSTLLYLTVPLYDKRFSEPGLRQALSMAVDRQAVMTAVLPAETPADDFAPPPVSGYRPAVCTYCVYNPDAAKQALADAGGWSGEMTLNFYGDDPTLAQAMEAIATQWKDNLGIDVKLNPINPNSYYDFTYGQKLDGPWWDGWVEDYPSLQDYLEPIYGSNGGYNLSGYSNPDFDNKLDEGNKLDPEAAIPVYQQADDIILQDMPSIPWGYLGFNLVWSDNITNVTKVPGQDLIDLGATQAVSAT